MDNTSFAPGNNSINNSVPPLTPQYSSPEPKHLPKLVTWVVLIVALGLSAFAGIWYWQDQKIGDDYVAVFTPRPSTTPDPTADWKTYINKDYGYEFKYPDGYVVSAGLSGANDWVQVYSSKPDSSGHNLTILNIATVNVGRESVFDNGSNVILDSIVFAGKQAKEYRCPEKNNCPSQLSSSRAIHLTSLLSNWQANNEIFYDIAKESPELKNLADQILSTFKFTK